MGLALEIVLPLRSLSPVLVWERLYGSHRRYLDAVGALQVHDGTLTASDIQTHIERSGSTHFHLEWDEASLGYSHVTNHDLSFVSVDGCLLDERDAESWVAPFLNGEFRQARLFDDQYELWQNAQDPLEYTTAAKSYEGLPMRSNNLPPPLQQLVIDTSGNPGRRVLRDGFIEGVGSPMWLGRDFWAITGGRREVVLGQRWMRSEVLADGVVRTAPHDGPFSSAEGEAGDVQRRIRALLFPTDP